MTSNRTFRTDDLRTDEDSAELSKRRLRERNASAYVQTGTEEQTPPAPRTDAADPDPVEAARKRANARNANLYKPAGST